MTEAKTAQFIKRIQDFGEVTERQHSQYGSKFVSDMIAHGGCYTSPQGVTFQIPTHFGFCYGVEKSIDMGFETRRRFPHKRIFLTHDVIHNPRVQHDLLEQGVKVLERDSHNQLILDDIKPEDVVVVAAFGSKYNDVQALRQKQCIVVDTTCGAIVMVWKRVEKYAKNGFTSIIHGIWNHEETQATASQTLKFNGHFLIIRDMREAKIIEAFLKQKISHDEFLKTFQNCISEGFNPDVHLKKIGIASQTTMLKTETLQIQEYLRLLYSSHFAEQEFKNVFMLYDTICSATQERQDALTQLLVNKPEVMIIIGGFNSSNTTHLSEIAALKCPTYHIRGPQDIKSKMEIDCLCPHTLKVKTRSSWLSPEVKFVGISTGASTPDLSIEAVIQKVEECLK